MLLWLYTKNISSIDDFIYSIVNPLNNKICVGKKKITDEHGIGQFINDYCIFDLTDDDREENGCYKLTSDKINNKINDYNINSELYSNVTFRKDKSMLFNLCATRDINENEELYLCYGIHYWISKKQLITGFTLSFCFCKNSFNTLSLKNFTTQHIAVIVFKKFRACTYMTHPCVLVKLPSYFVQYTNFYYILIICTYKLFSWDFSQKKLSFGIFEFSL